MKKGDIRSGSVQILVFISDYISYFFLVNHLDIGGSCIFLFFPIQLTDIIVSISCISYSCCQQLNSYTCGVPAKMVSLLDPNWVTNCYNSCFWQQSGPFHFSLRKIEVKCIKGLEISSRQHTDFLPFIFLVPSTYPHHGFENIFGPIQKDQNQTLKSCTYGYFHYFTCLLSK